MRTRKQGSALLIVLGFLSFMVVSAVAFAIYMRAERMPSSALRRAVATRHLVRAALAEAISRVDDAVRDDPFPGLCATNNNGTVADSARFYYYRSGSGGQQAIDVWDGRVFMPPDPQGGTIDAETRYAPVSETVSVLTLEGLGYLPPPLVNDVRFLSRSSWAASWQPLPFDSGRFAYCAVNVSDFLDVNRVSADKPRTSEAQRRLSVAHLFDQNFDPYDVFNNNNIKGSSVDNPNSSAASTFDDFTGKKAGSPYSGYVPGDNVGGTYEKWTAIGNTSPYVSMMDYNLALASGGPNSYFKPLFYNWLADKRRDKSYYIQDSSRSSEMYAALKQPFVTDSWSTNETWDVDISTEKGQPFEASLISKNNVTYDDVVRVSSDFNNKMDSGIWGMVDTAMLFDYLDHDNVPLSLAIPCVECVPMIVGIKPVDFSPKNFTKSGLGSSPDDPMIWKTDLKAWFDVMDMDLVVAFPFKNTAERRKFGNLTAQAYVRVVFAEEGVDPTKLKSIARPDRIDWNKQKLEMEAGRLIVSGATSEIPFAPPDDEEMSRLGEKGAYAGDKGMVRINSGHFDHSGLPSGLEILKKWEETPAQGQGAGAGGAVKEILYQRLVELLKADGTYCDVSNPCKEPDLGGAFVPHVFVWVRIMENGKTVDQVPAGLVDDRDASQKSISTALAQDCPGLVNDPAIGRPVFEFTSTDSATKFSLAKLDDFSGGLTKWDPQAVYAVDPRFNHLPEYWYRIDSNNITFEKWSDNTRDALAGDSTRDQDIFMFTSNQGILQSLGEFAFLPYLHDPGTGLQNYSFNKIDGNGNGVYGNSASEVLGNYTYMFRTYDAADFYRLASEKGIGRTHQRECLVNPHTGDLGVMLAALANPPSDYWAASQGVDRDSSALFTAAYENKSEKLKITNFADAKQKNLMFSSQNDFAMLTYKETVEIAKTIMGAMGGVELPQGDPMARNVVDVLNASNEPRLKGLKDDRLRNDMANAFKKFIRGDGGPAVRPSAVWQEIWDNLWRFSAFECQAKENTDNKDNDSFKTFLDVKLDNPLYTVDRKFLYSYWRDCFANNQQLFLIFVRAESSALGGPGEGTPAQLGGRAVALVWRDPDWSEGDGDSGSVRDRKSENNGDPEDRPHRTRVLFYHQFD